MIVPGPDNRLFKAIRGLVYVWIAVLVLALDPRTEDPAAPVKLLASGVAVAVAMVLWAVAIRTGRAPYRRMNPTLWYQFFFFFVLGLSAAFSEAPDRARLALCPWGVFAAMGFLVYQTFPHPRHLRNLFRAIAGCVALSSVYGLVQHLGWDPFPWADRNVEEYRALPATYGNPNLAGHALVIGLILCAGLMADAWQRKRGLPLLAAYGVLGSLMAAHLGLTGMRGGWVALSMAAFFVAAYRVARWTSRSRRRSGACALGACGAVMLLASVAAALLASRMNLDSSLQLRLNGYAGAAELFVAHPFLGIGPGNYAFQNIPHWSSFESLWYALEGKRNFHVHNEWLEMAAECGVPGLAGLIGLFVFSVVLFFNNPRLPAEKHRALFMAVPALIVAVGADACFGFNLHAPVSAGLFFLLIAQGPARPHYSPPVKKLVRKGALFMGALALGLSWPLLRDYAHERSYQRALGAVQWERNQRESGTSVDSSGHTAEILEQLTRAWPGDYRGRMLQGDFALEEGEAARAVESFGAALARHPFLPRLQVQMARAEIRLAQGAPNEALEALTKAEHYATLARDRCPELAEAWGILGWCGYVRTTLGAPDEERRAAIESFQRARNLGLTQDPGVDEALGYLYERGKAWPEAAKAYERSVRQTPDVSDRWVKWNRAAIKAGGASLDAHRQALLQGLHRAADAEAPMPPAFLEWICVQLSAISTQPWQSAVAHSALDDFLGHRPELLGAWSTWIGLNDPETRATRLRERLSQLDQPAGSTVSPVILALATALSKPELNTLEAASRELAGAIATAPGAEDFARNSLHTPLVALLDAAVVNGGQSDGVLLRDLGAVHFEIGDLAAAEEKLHAAEAVLPSGSVASTWYYHSRTLSCLGQHAAALSMAKAALDADGSRVEHQWQFARCLITAGRSDAAKFVYESLLAGLPPDHPYRSRLVQELMSLATPGATP